MIEIMNMMIMKMMIEKRREKDLYTGHISLSLNAFATGEWKPHQEPR